MRHVNLIPLILQIQFIYPSPTNTNSVADDFEIIFTRKSKILVDKRIRIGRLKDCGKKKKLLIVIIASFSIRLSNTAFYTNVQIVHNASVCEKGLNAVLFVLRYFLF